MAEIRCPMCSKPNPEDAVECSFCDARLKPLIADDQPSATPEPQPGAGSEEEVPDWLDRIRARAEEDQDPPEEPEEDGDTDWLSRLRSVETDESGPPEELPDWLEDDQEQPPAEEDWLSRLRQTSDQDEAETAEDEAAPVSDSDWDAEVPEPAADETKDQEQQLRDLIQDDEEIEGAGDEAEVMDWLDEEPEADFAQGEAPSWFEEDEVEEDESEAPSLAGEQEFEELSPAPFEDRPDWFDEFEEAAEEPVEPAESVELPESPETTEPEAMAEGENLESFDADELPDWLDEESLGAAEDLELEGLDLEPGPELEAEEGEGQEWQEFDWEALSVDEEAEEKPLPEGLGAPPEEQEEELPHVPALLMDDSEEGPAVSGADEFDLDAIELPDWLTEVDREAAAEEGGEPERSGDLAPATIPNWLEAMRPVETFQPVVDIEPEEERAVESVGPLAGLRGVLMAEPVVAKPRTSTSVGTRLQVSERQYAQAEILQRIIEREDHEGVGARERGERLPLFRWLISLVLFVAVLLPPATGFPRFAAPTTESRDLGTFREVINTAPADQPALVVFDYEPGYSAELEAVASTMLENLMARDVNIVTLSTRPTGPPLALDLLEDVGAPHEIENGRNYLHLGYLSGGPTAVQLFSIAPQEAILKGFMLPEELNLASGWEAPILRNVNQLSDFGLVAVITAGTDNARIWAEQAHPWLEDTPMVMVLSAGAEPMIRPYFESLDPQVDGILSGLPNAMAYEMHNQRAGLAKERWNAFGSGTLAVEVILAVGLAYGVIDWVLARRRKPEQG
ncbi:MAG: hypothetical protein ACLFWD_00240 [Anaerolineales bacterium]